MARVERIFKIGDVVARLLEQPGENFGAAIDVGLPGSGAMEENMFLFPLFVIHGFTVSRK